MRADALPDTTTLDRAVRLYIFAQAAATARVPRIDEIARALDQTPASIEDAVRRLADAHVLILAPNSTNIWAADPFCAYPSPFRVEARGRSYWGICIWHALGIPAILDADATVRTQCGDCGEEMVLEVRAGGLVRTEGVVHFAVPAARWWENIGFT